MSKFLVLVCFFALATCHAQEIVRSTTVFIKSGKVEPEPARNAIIELVTVTSEDVVNQNIEYAVNEAQSVVDTAVADIQSEIDKQENVGYIRGYVTQLGVMESIADTNAAISIVKFDYQQLPEGGSRCTTYTYFSKGKSDNVELQFTAALDSPDWTIVPSVETYATNITVAGVAYNTICNVIDFPAEYDSGFLRTQATLSRIEAGTYLPVRNGISVNGEEPLTGTFTVGTNTFQFVGGVRSSGILQPMLMTDEIENALDEQSPDVQPMMMRALFSMAEVEPEEPCVELTDDELKILMQANEILSKLNPE